MSENLRQGETWDYCDECRTPYVIEDLQPLVKLSWGAVQLFICRWHYRRRMGAAA